MGLGPNLSSPAGHSAWDYADSFNVRLANIQKAIENGQGSDPIDRRLPFNFECDAAGYGEVVIEIPRGVNIDLCGIAFTASNSGYVATYVNEESPFTLLKVNESAPIVTDDFSETDVTSSDRIFLIVARDQAASQRVAGNLRIRQYESGNDPVSV